MGCAFCGQLLATKGLATKGKTPVHNLYAKGVVVHFEVMKNLSQPLPSIFFIGDITSWLKLTFVTTTAVGPNKDCIFLTLNVTK